MGTVRPETSLRLTQATPEPRILVLITDSHWPWPPPGLAKGFASNNTREPQRRCSSVSTSKCSSSRFGYQSIRSLTPSCLPSRTGWFEVRLRQQSSIFQGRSPMLGRHTPSLCNRLNDRRKAKWERRRLSHVAFAQIHEIEAACLKRLKSSQTGR